MKGVILAGGLGTRLNPLTFVTNKHLLPVYHQPMIYYPIQTLVQAGIHDILIVTGGNWAGDFLKLLKNGKQFGDVRFHYAYQEGEGGIAHALSLAEDFSDHDSIAVILGDNLIEDNITPYVKRFETQDGGARICLKEVEDPERFGVAEIRGGKVVRVEEKPKRPKSKFAVTGLYFYDNEVFKMISTLKPSRRGELEITDVNNYYLRKGRLEHDILKGYWSDAGTFESLYRSSGLVRNRLAKAGKLPNPER
jgi:glucose-1-phosphate thymidylyltransferase